MIISNVTVETITEYGSGYSRKSVLQLNLPLPMGVATYKLYISKALEESLEAASALSGDTSKAATPEDNQLF